MPPVEYTEGVKACIQMAEAALGVKNTALDTLSNENESLRKENSQLVNLAAAKGGDQVPLLMQSLAQARLEVQHAQLEATQLRCRLQEETELRQDLERELEDTAAAAQELWESMQAVYSEAADSAVGSRTHSRAGSHASDGWGTPPGACTPSSSAGQPPQQQQRPQTPLQQGIAAAAAAALAAAAAAAAVEQQQQQGKAADTPAGLPVAMLGTPAAAAPNESTTAEGIAPAAAAAAAAAAGLNVPLTGILTPLEDKLQSLSSKLVGLVSWLDARDVGSPGSTPRSSAAAAARSSSNHTLMGSAAISPAAACGSAGMRVGPLPLGSPVGGSGCVYSVAAALDTAAGMDSPGSSVKGGDAAGVCKRKPSPRVHMAASLAAAAAAAGLGTDAKASMSNGGAAAADDTAANRAVDVCRIKGSC